MHLAIPPLPSSASTNAGDLALAIERMTAHLVPEGVLLIEPFIHADEFVEERVVGHTFDEAHFKVARFGVPRREGRTLIWDVHYLVATPEGVEYFVEPHRLGLFSRTEYEGALTAAGLDATHEAEGPRGGGIYIGVK